MLSFTSHRSMGLAGLMVLVALPAAAQHAPHGEGDPADALALPATTAVYSAELPPIPEGPVKKFRVPLTHTTIEIAPGVFYEGWTLGGTVPGPAIHVEQGDRVEIWVVNEADLAHSVDFHSGRMAPSRWYRDIEPGDSLRFEFVANDPGAFMVHCGSAPVLAHIANGMYLPMIVRPKGLPMADREFVITQSEFYAADGGYGLKVLDSENALNGAPNFVAFNGRSRLYMDNPIDVEVGVPYRAWVVNAGPNRTSAFHIVGTIFDRVVDGDPTGALYNVQTWNIAPGGGAMFEFTFPEVGQYPFVTHAFSDATKGALGVFRAGGDRSAIMQH